MHSHVKAGGNVSCIGAKGLVVGGSIQAGDTVPARTVGNAMSTATVIEVGVKPELREELTELRKETRALAAGLDKTEKALSLLDQLAGSGLITPDKLAMRIKLGATKNSPWPNWMSSRKECLKSSALLKTPVWRRLTLTAPYLAERKS